MASRPDSLAKWYERIVLESTGYYRRAFTDPWTGERHRASLKTKDRDEAARAVRDWFEIAEHTARKAALVASGLITKEEAAARKKITLAQACADYMREHGDKLPSGDQMRGQHDVLITLLGAVTFLGEITTADLHRMVKTLEKETVHYRDGDRPMAETTINAYPRRLRTLLNYARKKWYAACHAQEIDWAEVLLPEPKFKRTLIASDDDEDRLRDALGDDLARVFDFAIASGKRKSEVVNLQKSQVAWPDGVVGKAGGVITFRIKSQLRDRRQHNQSATFHQIPITPLMATILAAAWRASDCAAVFTYVPRKGRTWVDASGERQVRRAQTRIALSIYVLDKAWDAARIATGLTSTRWHDLRARKITELLQEGNSPVDVQQIIGHGKVETTMLYATPSQAKQREALERSEQLRSARRASRSRQTGTGTTLKLVK